MRPVHVPDRGGRYLCSGSVLPDLREGDVVWGSGVVRPGDLKGVPPHVKFCAVRGPWTRGLLVDRFGQEVPEVYGDPCLLIPKLFDIPKGRRRGIGLAPHFTEYEAAASLPHRPLPHGAGGISLIDVTSGFWPVIRAVNRCAAVLSSSLHVLMLADALGVPNAFVRFVRIPPRGSRRVLLEVPRLLPLRGQAAGTAGGLLGRGGPRKPILQLGDSLRLRQVPRILPIQLQGGGPPWMRSWPRS